MRYYSSTSSFPHSDGHKMGLNPSFLEKLTSFKTRSPQVQDGPSNNRNPRLVAVGLSSSAGLHWKTFTSCSRSSTLILRGESSKSWPCSKIHYQKETTRKPFSLFSGNPIWIRSIATDSRIPLHPLEAAWMLSTIWIKFLKSVIPIRLSLCL